MSNFCPESQISTHIVGEGGRRRGRSKVKEIFRRPQGGQDVSREVLEYTRHFRECPSTDPVWLGGFGVVLLKKAPVCRKKNNKTAVLYTFKKDVPI